MSFLLICQMVMRDYKEFEVDRIDRYYMVTFDCFVFRFCVVCLNR